MQVNDSERENWASLQSDLEGKLAQARNLNNNLQSELDKARSNHADTERDLRSEMDRLTWTSKWWRRVEDSLRESGQGVSRFANAALEAREGHNRG